MSMSLQQLELHLLNNKSQLTVYESLSLSLCNVQFQNTLWLFCNISRSPRQYTNQTIDLKIFRRQLFLPLQLIFDLAIGLQISRSNHLLARACASSLRSRFEVNRKYCWQSSSDACIPTIRPWIGLDRCNVEQLICIARGKHLLVKTHPFYRGREKGTEKLAMETS